MHGGTHSLSSRYEYNRNYENHRSGDREKGIKRRREDNDYFHSFTHYSQRKKSRINSGTLTHPTFPHKSCLKTKDVFRKNLHVRFNETDDRERGASTQSEYREEEDLLFIDSEMESDQESKRAVEGSSPLSNPLKSEKPILSEKEEPLDLDILLNLDASQQEKQMNLLKKMIQIIKQKS